MGRLFEKFNFYLGPIALCVYLLFYALYGQAVLNKDENMLFIMLAHVHFPLTAVFLCFGKQGNDWLMNIMSTQRRAVAVFGLSFLVVFISYYYKAFLKSQDNILHVYYVLFTLLLVGLTALHLARQTLGVSNLMYEGQFRFKRSSDLFFILIYVFSNTLQSFILVSKDPGVSEEILKYTQILAMLYFIIRMTLLVIYTRNIKKIIFETRFFFFLIFTTSLLAAGTAGVIHSLEYVFIHYNLQKNSGWAKGKEVTTYMLASAAIMGLYLFMVLVRTGYIFLSPGLLNLFATIVLTYNTMHVIVDWALFSNYFSISKLLIRPLLK